MNAGANKMLVNGTTFGLRTFNLDEKSISVYYDQTLFMTRRIICLHFFHMALLKKDFSRRPLSLLTLSRAESLKCPNTSSLLSISSGKSPIILSKNNGQKRKSQFLRESGVRKSSSMEKNTLTLIPNFHMNLYLKPIPCPRIQGTVRICSG